MIWWDTKHAGESFWVEVTDINEKSVTGKVCNDLFNAPWKYGDTVRFQNANISMVKGSKADEEQL